jgi:hypothetical protein
MQQVQKVNDIARDVKIVPRAAGEQDYTSRATTIFGRVA